MSGAQEYILFQSLMFHYTALPNHVDVVSEHTVSPLTQREKTEECDAPEEPVWRRETGQRKTSQPPCVACTFNTLLSREGYRGLSRAIEGYRKLPRA